MLRNLLENVLDIIFPPKCFVCGGIITDNHSRAVCKTCEGRVAANVRFVCGFCGAGLADGISACGTCEEERIGASRNISFTVYDELVKNIIHVFKYNDHSEYAFKLVEYIDMHMDFSSIGRYDALIAVPMYKKKKKRRGFNQADVLAMALSDTLKIPVLEGVLIRIKNTAPQSNLSPAERLKNIEGAFEVIETAAINGKRILLIDDVFTTGSTIAECAKMLRCAGAAEVSSFTFARAGNDG